MVCRLCRAALAHDARIAGARNEANFCPQCHASIPAQQRSLLLREEEVWMTDCPHCGFQLRWDRCAICREAFFGPLPRVKWVERGGGNYHYPRDLSVCEACRPTAELEKAACLAANARIDSQ